MEKQVEFKIGNETLRGSLFVPKGEGPFPGAVLFHGRGSNRTRYLPIAEKLSENGIISLVFDFRGCGESDGKFENQTHLMGIEDGEAGLKFLLEQNVDKNKIGILGTSFGGYVAGMLLKNVDFIKSVVLRVPAAYSDETLNVEAEVEAGYFERKENWINSSSYKGLEKFKGELLVIRSEKDELLSSEEVEKYYDVAKNASKRKLYVQKGAGHSFKTDPEGLKLFQKITADWLLETL